MRFVHYKIKVNRKHEFCYFFFSLCPFKVSAEISSRGPFWSPLSNKFELFFFLVFHLFIYSTWNHLGFKHVLKQTNLLDGTQEA